jgi:hypothetical protein
VRLLTIFCCLRFEFSLFVAHIGNPLCNSNYYCVRIRCYGERVYRAVEQIRSLFTELSLRNWSIRHSIMKFTPYSCKYVRLPQLLKRSANIKISFLGCYKIIDYQSFEFFLIHLYYKICRVCNKYRCSISTGS